MPKVSVIVPVYNVEKYLEKCLDTLVNQTLEDIEIIVVNDGTPDNSQQIIDKYVSNYPEKVKSYIKENGGLSSARNFGLRMATGEYISFVDSDDYVELDMMEKLYKKTEEFKYDVVCSDVNIIYPDKEVEAKSNIESDNKKLSLKDKKNIILNAYPVAWNKIYRREIISGKLLFEKGIWFEDVLFLYKLAPSINSIAKVDYKLYNYLQREGAITYTFNEKLYDLNKILKILIDYYKKENIYDEYEDILEYTYVRYMFATFIKRVAKSKDKKMFKKAVKYAIDDVKETFPNYKKNIFLKEKCFKNIYLRHFNRLVSKIIFYIEKDKMN